MRFTRLNRPALVLLILCLAARLQTPAGVNAQSSSSNKLDVVQQAFNLLYTGYVYPVTADQLLQDAWDGINMTLTGAGKPTVSAPAFTGDPNADWSAFAAAYQQLVSTNVALVNDLAYGAINQMTNGLNSCHTTFITPDEAQATNGEETHQPTPFTGFDAGDNYLVYRVYPGSPAEQAGIQPGDTLLTSAGKGRPGVLRRIEDTPAGKSIAITLMRPGVSDPISVTLVPQLTVLPFVRTQVLSGGIGVIEFDDFTEGAGLASAVRGALNDFESQGVVGWILDLRTSPGGDANSMAAVASLFLKSGKIVTNFDRAGGRDDVFVDPSATLPVQRPLVVLTGPYSASAGEMLPGALKDDGRAYLIGDKTFGCIGSAVFTSLSDGSALEVQVRSALIGNDNLNLNGVGVTPDETITRTPEQLQAGQDLQMDRAVQYLLAQAGH